MGGGASALREGPALAGISESTRREVESLSSEARQELLQHYNEALNAEIQKLGGSGKAVAAVDEGTKAPEVVGTKSSAMPNVYFVPEADLKDLKYLPRRGCNEDFVHKVTGRGNNTVHQPVAFFEGRKVCFVFISHRWLRPGNGARGTPDDDDNSKCKLILAALEELRGPNAPVPEDVEFAIWLDYSCMDQDAAPGSELQELHSIVAACDLMLTPIVDKDHTKWEAPTPLPVAGWLEAYKAPAWEEYWSRGWVRAHARPAERLRARGGRTPF